LLGKNTNFIFTENRNTQDSSEECLVDNCLTNETLKKADLNIEVVQENKEKDDFEDFKIPSDYIDLLENFEIEVSIRIPTHINTNITFQSIY